MSDLLNQASLVYIPSGYKEDKAYSVIPTDGSGDLTFTRASDGTRVNSAGLVENVPWNLLQQSNTFSTTWIQSNATVTSGQSGYDGSSDAWLLSKSAANGYIYQNVSSGLATFSVYAKAGSLNWLYVLKGGNSGQYFNLASGVLGSSTGTTPIDANIENVGGDWYRCSLTYIDAYNGSMRIYPADGNNDTSGTSGNIYIQDAQLNTGSTAKPYFPTTDRLNVPRLTYSGGCPSLLLEPQRTNLVTYSEDFTNAAWNQNTATITANTTVSPDGTQNADTATNVSGTQIGQSQGGGVIGQSYTFSVWIKRLVGSGAIQIRDINNTAATISVTSEWQRFQITGTASSTTLRAYFNITTIGDSIAIWGAQLEAGSYPTSYIPTTSASVTRVADAASKTGISSLIGQSEGTLFAEVDLRSTSSTKRILYLSDGTTNNEIRITSNASNVGDIQYAVRVAGVLEVNSFSPTNVYTNGIFKIAVAYKLNDFVLYINGLQILTDTSGTVPACSRIDVGSQLGTSNFLDDKLYQATIYKTRLTNAELATLTTI